MKPHIYGLEELKESQIFYLSKISAPSKVLYLFLLFVIIAGLVSLPLISVTITTSSPAVIESYATKENVYAPFSGRISKINFQNNDRIKKTDTLFFIDNSVNSGNTSALLNRRKLLLDNIKDINALSSSASSTPDGLSTDEYKSELNALREQRNELQIRYENALKTYNRNRTLYEDKVISASEFEKYDLQLKDAQSELTVLDKKFQTRLQSSKSQLRQEVYNLDQELSQYREISEKSTILANISGTAYLSEGFQVGSNVQTGQIIAEVMPDSLLTAVCYVSPKDIGFVKDSQHLTLQVEAFNYLQWGMLPAKVFEIGNDIIISNGQPFFKVKCKLQYTTLSLKNGVTGNIKKGMTAKANFELTRRTLWQLLFDKINDWLNPRNT